MQSAGSTSDSESNTRKRVCKACDRCRLKKSKCDGANPCSRCQADNSICVFGERKKSHDKVYPKGYVEMLEQQQYQLVNGIRELYRCAVDNSCWSGAPLNITSTGHPLTHDILERIGALKVEPFDEDADFEDDLGILRRTASAKEAERMTPRPSTAGSSFSSSQASYPDQLSPKTAFGCDQMFLPLQQQHQHQQQQQQQFPPTPPDQSPSELSPAQFAPFFGAHPSMAINPVGPPAQQQTWVQPSPGHYDACMDFMTYDVPPNYPPLGMMQPKANPCLPIPMNFMNENDLEQQLRRNNHIL